LDFDVHHGGRMRRNYFPRIFPETIQRMDRQCGGRVLLSAAAFGAGHIYQGWRSAIVVLVYGSLFGILAEARESLRPGMMTHAWHDGFVGLVGRLVVK
jgi:membrane protease YdiL (CAAX protease family)